MTYALTARQFIDHVADGAEIGRRIYERTLAVHIAHPRQEAMAALYEAGRGSYVRIARLFDRDHTTVVHARKVVLKRAAKCGETARRFNAYVRLAQEEGPDAVFIRHGKVGFKSVRGKA